jgi:excisionase family DNA binding protein
MRIDRAMPEKPWLTAKEAANYLGVTTTTLYSYVKLRKNRPPAFRLAGKPKGIWRFPREEFIQWANGSNK